jgi:hypothetical protein
MLRYTDLRFLINRTCSNTPLNSPVSSRTVHLREITARISDFISVSLLFVMSPRLGYFNIFLLNRNMLICICYSLQLKTFEFYFFLKK